MQMSRVMVEVGEGAPSRPSEYRLVLNHLAIGPQTFGILFGMYLLHRCAYDLLEPLRIPLPATINCASLLRLRHNPMARWKQP